MIFFGSSIRCTMTEPAMIHPIMKMKSTVIALDSKYAPMMSGVPKIITRRTMTGMMSEA